MKITTKKVSAFVIGAALIGLPMITGAQFDPNRGIGDTGLSDQSFADLLMTIIEYLLAILTFLAVLGFIISGVIFITAGGSKRADDAKTWLTNSIIGIIVGLIGYIVIRLISSILSGNAEV